jgi:predicted dehydrogenase
MTTTAKSGRRPPLRIGLAGAGMISHYHLIAWSRDPRTKVVALCDPDLAQAKRRSAEFAIPAVYGDLEAMLAGQELDAVDVASPRDTHAALVEAAAARGIDVLCQKPLAPAFASGEALAQRVAGKARLMVHENWRFRPWYRSLKRWLDAGDTGRLLQADMATLSSGLLPDATGRRPALERQPFMAKEARLMIAEVLIHHLDVLRWLFGPLRVVSARTAHTLAEVRGETLAAIFLETSAGAPVTLRGTMAAPGFPAGTGDRLEVVGSKASALFEGMELRLLGATGQQESFDFARDYQGSFDGAIRHFVDCVISGTPFETDVQDNLETLRLVEDSYAAAALSPAPK